MATVSELVDKGDIPEERKDNVKRILHDLGYEASRAVGKAFLKITEKQMTDAGMSIADANAILAELEPVQDATFDMPSTQDVSVHVEDGKSYTVTLYNGRLDVKALDKRLADEGLVLKTLNGVIPGVDANGMSRTIFSADIQANTQPKKDEELIEKQKLRVWSTWQWGVGLSVGVITLVMVMVRFFQGKSVNVPGIPSSGK